MKRIKRRRNKSCPMLEVICGRIMRFNIASPHNRKIARLYIKEGEFMTREGFKTISDRLSSINLSYFMAHEDYRDL